MVKIFGFVAKYGMWMTFSDYLEKYNLNETEDWRSPMQKRLDAGQFDEPEEEKETPIKDVDIVNYILHTFTSRENGGLDIPKKDLPNLTIRALPEFLKYIAKLNKAIEEFHKKGEMLDIKPVEITGPEMISILDMLPAQAGSGFEVPFIQRYNITPKTRPILVCQFGTRYRIIDGHNQWAARMFHYAKEKNNGGLPNDKAPDIILHVPFTDLIKPPLSDAIRRTSWAAGSE